MFEIGQKVRVKRIVEHMTDNPDTVESLEKYIGREGAIEDMDGLIFFLDGIDPGFYKEELEAVDETIEAEIA